MKDTLRKRCIIMLCLLLVCFTISACGTSGGGSANGNSEETGKGNSDIVTVDPNGEPEIVVDENQVELEERHDAQGNHVGYYRYTAGTNCGVYGCVKLEYLDLDKNVLKTFEPQMAGCTMGCGMIGENDINEIWESNDAGTSIEYGIEPFTNGKIRTCIYTLAGSAIRVDIYGEEGQIVASVEPSAEGKRLDLIASDEGYYVVSEGYEDDSTSTLYTEREYIYNLDGTRICDISYINDVSPDVKGYRAISLELRNANGDIRGFQKLEEDSRLAVFITDAGTTLTIGEYLEYGQTPIKTVVYDPVNDIVIDTQIVDDYQK